MTTEPRSDISPLSRALDELEQAIIAGKAAHRAIADACEHGIANPGTMPMRSEAHGHRASAVRLGELLEAVREELRKYLPQQLALRARDLLDKDLREAMGGHPVARSGEWVDAVRDFLALVANSRVGAASEPDEDPRVVGYQTGPNIPINPMKCPQCKATGPQDREGFVRCQWCGHLWNAASEPDEDPRVVGYQAGPNIPINPVSLARTVIDKYGADADKPSVHLAKALLDGAHERDSMREERSWDKGIILNLQKEVERTSLPARRYERLRILGVAPYGTKQLEAGSVLCFQNLDEFVDADLAAHPNRGDVRVDVPLTTLVPKLVMTTRGERQRHIYDAADRSRYCKWCNEEEYHPVHVARSAAPLPSGGIFDMWEEAPAVRDQPWVAALKHADAIRSDVERGLTSAQIRDEIISKVGMMASARTPEMQARYDAALERESVKRRVVHDLTVIAARMVRDYPGVPPQLALGDIRRMANFVLAHAGEGPVTPPASHATTLTEQQLSMALRCSVDEWSASATEETLFDLWCNHVGVTANTYGSALAYAAFRAARDYFRTVTPAGAAVTPASVPHPFSPEAVDRYGNVVHRSPFCQVCGKDEAHHVAELVYEVPPAPLVIDEPPALQDRQDALRVALDEMRRALTAIRLEVPQSVADEMSKRFETVVEAFRRRHAGPSAELVALRFFHDNVSERLRAIRQLDSSTKRALGLARLEDDVLTNSGQALMKSRQLDAITVTLSGTAPATATGGTVVSAGTWTEMPPVTVAKGADGTLSVGPPPDGRPISDHLDDLAAGNNKPRTPEQRVIDIARRVVSRGIHHRRTLDELMRGKDLNLLHNDLQGLIWLADAVTALDKATPSSPTKKG